MPPIPRASGGMFVIAELANHLALSGRQTFIVTRGPMPAGVEIVPEVGHILLENLELKPSDRWIVPEGWPLALKPGLAANAACAVYVQNWAFLFGTLPKNLSWTDLPLAYISVSSPVAMFIKETLGAIAPVIRPAIDPDLFYPPREAATPLKAGEKPRIAWMPRKNRGLARQILDIFTARQKLMGLPEVEWLEIQGKSRVEVAEILRQSHIFLATGFPEGCPLPPLESMASGCILTGFAGFGGWDYMRQAWKDGYVPSWPLDDRPWGANGFYAADADVFGAALCVEKAIRILEKGGAPLTELRTNALKTASWYSPSRQKSTVIDLWNNASFWKVGPDT